MGTLRPSTEMAGHWSARVTTRAVGMPPGPTTTNTAWARSALSERTGAADNVRAPAKAGMANRRITMPASSERSEEHTSELQSLMRLSYAVFCLKKKHTQQN